jgi:hypothetical protein
MLLRVLENGFVKMKEIAIKQQVRLGLKGLEIGSKRKLIYAENCGV